MIKGNDGSYALGLLDVQDSMPGHLNIRAAGRSQSSGFIGREIRNHDFSDFSRPWFPIQTLNSSSQYTVSFHAGSFSIHHACWTLWDLTNQQPNLLGHILRRLSLSAILKAEQAKVWQQPVLFREWGGVSCSESTHPFLCWIMANAGFMCPQVQKGINNCSFWLMKSKNTSSSSENKQYHFLTTWT